MHTLKPCPFCGGQAELDSSVHFRAIASGEIERAVSVYCTDCTAEITICVPDVPDIQPDQVAEMWNTRAQKSEPQK